MKINQIVINNNQLTATFTVSLVVWIFWFAFVCSIILSMLGLISNTMRVVDHFLATCVLIIIYLFLPLVHLNINKKNKLITI